MKSPNDTQTTSTAPWEALQPYLLGQEATDATEGYWTEGGDALAGDGDGNGGRTWVPGTPAQEAIPGLFSEAQALYDQGPQSYYPDQTYAGFTDAQKQGQQGALDFAQGGMMNAANSALGANQMMTSGDLLYANSNPYLQQNISDANSLIARDFNEQVVPGISRAAQGAGQYGSSREGIAQGIAARGVGDAIQRNTNQMMNSAYGMGLNAMATGVGQSKDALSAGLSPYQLQQDIGGIQQQQNQLGINDKVNAYNFNQQAPWQNLSNYQGALTGNYMGSGGTSTVPVTGSNPLGTALGLAGLGMGIYSGGVGAGLWGGGAGAGAGAGTAGLLA